MKIADILKELGPRAPIKPIGSTIGAGTVKRKTPLNPLGANKQLQNVGQQMLNKADQNTEQGPDKAKPSAETNFNRAMGKTITTGTIDPNLEQSGREYTKDLQGQLKNAQQPKAKPAPEPLNK